MLQKSWTFYLLNNPEKTYDGFPKTIKHKQQKLFNIYYNKNYY